MRRMLVALLLAIALFPPVQAAPLVADISTYRIAIDAGFTGMRLFIFGARNEPGEVAVVVRGPERTYTVRRKERVAGMWVNGAQMTFKSIPDFYTVAANRDMAFPATDALFRRLRIGEESLFAAPQNPKLAALFPEFSAAFLKYQQSRRLYGEKLPLSFMGETLFKTVVPFPDTIAPGDYTVEIYLISDGELTGMQVLPVKVEKSGLDALVAGMAHHYPALYGMTAVALALLAGWAATRLLEKV